MPAQSVTVVQPISLLGIGFLRSGTSFYARSARFRPQDSRVMTAYPGQRERRFIRAEEFAQDFVKRICEFDLFCRVCGIVAFFFASGFLPRHCGHGEDEEDGH